VETLMLAVAVFILAACIHAARTEPALLTRDLE
jgi:hypothetical protein